jgi:hypothetical protein
MDNIDDYINAGGKVTICPTINNLSDRERINGKRKIIKPEKKIVQHEIISSLICTDCPDRNKRKCLTCPKYKEFQRQSGTREQILFDYLPNILIEEIADKVKPGTLRVLKSIPLEYSVLIFMRYFIGSNLTEIGTYTKQTKKTIIGKLQTGLGLMKMALK